MIKYLIKIKNKILSALDWSYYSETKTEYKGTEFTKIKFPEIPDMSNIMDGNFKFPEFPEIPDIEFPLKNDKNFTFTYHEIRDEHFIIKTETAFNKKTSQSFKRITKTLK